MRKLTEYVCAKWRKELHDTFLKKKKKIKSGPGMRNAV